MCCRPPSWASTPSKPARNCWKALLIQLGHDYPRTHNLGALQDLVELHDQALPTLGLPLHRLNDYAVPYRYDDLPPGFQVDVVELRRTVDALRAHVEGRLQALVAPVPEEPVQDAGRQPESRGHGPPL
jgi:hypothetical protein